MHPTLDKLISFLRGVLNSYSFDRCKEEPEDLRRDYITEWSLAEWRLAAVERRYLDTPAEAMMGVLQTAEPAVRNAIMFAVDAGYSQGFEDAEADAKSKLKATRKRMNALRHRVKTDEQHTFELHREVEALGWEKANLQTEVKRLREELGVARAAIEAERILKEKEEARSEKIMRVAFAYERMLSEELRPCGRYDAKADGYWKLYGKRSELMKRD